MQQAHSPHIRTLWLILLAAATLTPLNPPTPAVHATATVRYSAATQEAIPDAAPVAVERTDLRGPYTKVFQRPDGSGYALSYPVPIHYKGHMGTWEPIDNQLIADPTTAGVYQNGDNTFSVQVAANTNEVHLNELDMASTLQFANGALTLALTPRGINPTQGHVQGSSITYPDVLPGVDLIYTVRDMGIAFDYTLQNAPAAPLTLELQAQVTGGTLTQQDDTLVLAGGDVEPMVFTLTAADSLRNLPDVAAWELQAQDNGSFLILITLDNAALQAAQPAYPVKIIAVGNNVHTDQPALAASQDVRISKDAYAQSGAPDVPTGSQFNMYLGQDTLFDKGTTRIFVRFDVPRLPPGAFVTDAHAILYQYNVQATGSYETELCRVVNDWGEWELHWDNQPDVTPCRPAETVDATEGWKQWNITDYIADWQSGAENHGLSIRAKNENLPGGIYYTLNCVSQCPGQERPYMRIDYEVVDVDIDKSVSNRVVRPGDTIDYTIVLTATGNAASVSATDTLTAGLTYVPGSVSGGAIYDEVTQQIRYADLLEPDNPVTITYQATIDPTLAPGSILYNPTILATTAYTIERGAAVSIADPSVLNTLVLIYANGDNDLSSDMLNVANRTMQAAANEHATILLLLDGPNDGDSYLYRLAGSEQWCSFYAGIADPTCGGRYEQDQNMWRWGEDMGSPYSLSEFVIAAFNAYPNAQYDQVVLSLVGHGGGWSPDLLNGQPQGHSRKPGEDPLGGLLWDDNPGSSLSTNDLGVALAMSTEATGQRIGLLFLDACLMSMVEVAYEVRGSVDYLLASQNWAWTVHSYDAHIAAVDRTSDVLTLGEAWMENDASRLEADEYPFTYALSDLSQIEAVLRELNTLSDALLPLVSSDRDKFEAAFAASDCFETDGNGTINEHDNYCDLASFAEQISAQFDDPEIHAAATAVQDALHDVVRHESHRGGIPWEYADEHWAWGDLGGLSLYMPLKEDEWKRRYYNDSHLQFARDSQWDDVLTAYWAAAEIPADPECPLAGCDHIEGPFPLAPISADVRTEEASNHIEWQMVDVENDMLTNQAVTAYQIYRRAGDGIFGSTPITTTAADTFVYVDSELPDAESNEWCYQVKATDETDTIIGESNVACTSTVQQQVYLPLVRR